MKSSCFSKTIGLSDLSASSHVKCSAKFAIHSLLLELKYGRYCRHIPPFVSGQELSCGISICFDLAWVFDLIKTKFESGRIVIDCCYLILLK